MEWESFIIFIRRRIKSKTRITFSFWLFLCRNYWTKNSDCYHLFLLHCCIVLRVHFHRFKDGCSECAFLGYRSDYVTHRSVDGWAPEEGSSEWFLHYYCCNPLWQPVLLTIIFSLIRHRFTINPSSDLLCAIDRYLIFNGSFDRSAVAYLSKKDANYDWKYELHFNLIFLCWNSVSHGTGT